MTQNQTTAPATDTSNPKPKGNSTPQEVPAPETTKPAQQPAPQAIEDAPFDKAADTDESAPASDSASTGDVKA